ncbi:C39 family peptidase [Leptospira borgpetersenii]|uniref:C39 family peptidase n=1 Tax=Leptospira borgpetersenii TaxID=174 RepID=UPI00396A9847
MAVGAGLGAVTGAASGGLKGALVGAVGGAAGAAVKSFTGGAVNVGLSYSAENGFGASLSKSFSNGVNGGISWSEKGGVGGNIGYEAPGDKNKPKDSLANQMKGAGGTLSFSQRDGMSAALNASGGVNAGNWSESGGFQANTNFLADKWKADFVSGKAKEDADAQEASRAAQNKNNSESGAAAIAGAGVATQRREEDGILDHILGKAAETLGGGLDWVGNKIDGAIDSVVGVASSAWDGAKNALGFGKGESLSMKPLHHENAGDASHYYDKDGNMRIRVADSNGDVYYRAATPEEAHRLQNNNDLAMTSNKGGTLSSLNNFLEAFDNKINGSGKFETNDQRSLRESEAHQKLVDNLAGTDKAILEKYGNRIASPDEVAAHYGKNAGAYSEQFHFLKDGNGNIVGKIVRDTAYENQTDAQFRDRTRGISSSNICSLASSAGMLMSEGIPQKSPGQKFADELAGGFVERIPSSEAQKPSERITATFRENVEIYSNGTKTGNFGDPLMNSNVDNGRFTDSGKYHNNAKIKELLDRGIPVMTSTKLSSSGHITYIVGYDNNKNTWITHDPYGDKNQANYGKQGSTAGRAVEYGQNTNGIGDRRIYWMEDKK